MVGALALQVERAGSGAVPVGLVNGDTHRGGHRPPFDPQAIVAALQLAAADPAVTDADLLAAAGPPSFPGGCDLDGDIPALLAGKAGGFRLRAGIEIVTIDRQPTIDITRLPPGVGSGAVMHALHAVADGRDWHGRHTSLAGRAALPLLEMNDMSSHGRHQIRCTPQPDADPDVVARTLRSMWPIETGCHLHRPAPLADLLRAWPGPAADTAGPDVSRPVRGPRREVTA